ncbi:MAG TPA: NADH-quinone oxidoreductase subunit M [Rudaea sp.]|jgi:NADH-quinone oxidoreductase subunit M|uniref:NADH-quinone oxidoreductase subunit M n=1 Tax=Rudaea sp. TaxID=2136325 RepID=UPI002F94262E
MQSAFPLLTLLIWLPIAGAAVVLLFGERANTARWLALAIAVVTLVASVPLLTGYDAGAGTMQFVENTVWIGAIHANYHLGVDGISVALIVLTTFVTVLVILGAWEAVQTRVSQYLAAFLVLEGVMIGVFAAMDALLFYVFFEGMLIPMFIIIGVWGGPRRVYATMKFFLYTFFGSIFMLIALIYLYLQTNSWELSQFAALPIGATAQGWLFFAFLAGFAIKVPMWPVHTWLPDAHVEAPTGGSVILAAIMLKIGGYGFLRFSLPIVPDACQQFTWLIVVLSLIAVIYVGFVALVQEDMKKLIAYSSVSHMGFVTLGIFISLALMRVSGDKDAAYLGVSGAMVQMVSHGFISGAMFSCVGVLYDRTHSRMIKDYGGVVNTMPWFAALWVLFSMANCGLPGTSGFVGEFMVILASFAMSPWVAAGAAFTLIIGAAYTLWLVKRVIFGDVANKHVAELADIDVREALVLGAFAAATLLVGIWPAPLTHLMDASVRHIVDQLLVTKL